MMQVFNQDVSQDVGEQVWVQDTVLSKWNLQPVGEMRCGKLNGASL